MLCLSVHLLICFQSTIGGTYLSMPVSQLFPDMGSGTLFPGEVCNRAKGNTTWGLFPRIHSPILPVLLRVSLFAQCPFPCLVSSLAWQLSNCFESGGDVRLSWTSLVYSWVDVASLWKKILPAIPIYSWIAGRFYCCCLDHQCSSFNCPATLWHSEQSGEQFSSMWWWPLLPQQIREGSWYSPLRLLQCVLQQRSDQNWAWHCICQPLSVCQELVLTSQLCNTGARLSKWGRTPSEFCSQTGKFCSKQVQSQNCNNLQIYWYKCKGCGFAFTGGYYRQ